MLSSASPRAPRHAASPQMLALALLVATWAPSLAQSTLVESDFSGSAPGANTPWAKTLVLDPVIVFHGWELGPQAGGQADIDDALGFDLAAPSSEQSLAAALAEGEHVFCTLEAVAGETLELGGVRMRFSVQRRSWHAARRYAVFTSVEGFTEDAALFISPRIESGDESVREFTFFFPEEGYGGLGGPVEIRIVAFEGQYAGHDTSLSAFELVSGLVSHAVSVDALGGGSITLSPNTERFEHGASARVIATPDPGWRFGRFVGDASGRQNPLAFRVTRDMRVRAHFEPLPAAHMELATNLAGVSDWSSEWAFKDVFRRARAWLTRNADGSGEWHTGYGAEIPRDTEGWPLSVPFDPSDGGPPQMVHTILVAANEGGDYRFLYEGSGTLRFAAEGSAALDLPTGGARSYDFTLPARGQVTIEIRATDPAPEHLRNFRIVRVADLASYESAPFHALFLERLAPYASGLRFMDWGHTNGSPLASWDARTTPASYTQARGEGVSLELMAELANTLGVDAWICIPHAADDEYVRRAAELLRDRLDPSLELLVEYSNETWNTAAPFSQTIYVQDQGEALDLDPDRWRAGQLYAARRSAEIWAIFEEVFGPEAPARVVKVLGTQSANLALTNTRVSALNDPAINPTGLNADALAIAPYFGRTYGPEDIPPAAPAYPTVDELLDVDAPTDIDVTVRGHVAAQRAIAREQGYALVAYEGGQHYVGIGDAVNDETLTGILHDANRDPRMGLRYEEYLTMLREEGVASFYNFSSVGEWSKWGSWGVLEYQDQPIADAPKYDAIVDWEAAWVGQGPHDVDADGTSDELDCDDRNALVSSVPGEVEALDMGDGVTISWDAPALPGGDPARVVYDLLVADDPAALASARCVACAHFALSARLEERPAPGAALFVLVRATNGCGPGSSGRDSAGAERARP